MPTKEEIAADVARLSPRTQTVVLRILRGRPLPEIAGELGISEPAVLTICRGARVYLGWDSALSQALEAELALRRRRPRTYATESRWVHIVTTAGPDGHVHVARINDNGNGKTDVAPDGHYHPVHELEFKPAADGHTHDIDRRAEDSK